MLIWLKINTVNLNGQLRIFLFFSLKWLSCNSRFKSSLELMLCVIDISTLNKTYLIWSWMEDMAVGHNFELNHSSPTWFIVCEKICFSHIFRWLLRRILVWSCFQKITLIYIMGINQPKEMFDNSLWPAAAYIWADFDLQFEIVYGQLKKLIEGRAMT